MKIVNDLARFGKQTEGQSDWSTKRYKMTTEKFMETASSRDV